MDVDNCTAAGMEAKSAMRSCTTCSKAKAKCVRRSGHETCERCHRLQKECSSREPVLRRKKIMKTTRAAQLEKLETKIEHLVNALSTSQAQRSYSTDLGHPSPPISQVSSDRPSNQKQAEVLSSLCLENEGKDGSPISTTSASPPGVTNTCLSSSDMPSPPIDNYQSLGVSMSEAEILLDRYRRLMSHHMPFVILSTNSTAAQLYNEKPFLLHAIVTVTYFHDLPKQQVMVKQLMRDVTERLLMNNEKSLDVLQGILVFVGWYHPHVFWGQQVTNLLHLAMAMTIDMGIDRPPQVCGEHMKGPPAKVNPATITRLSTLDEHRALAGTYYLTSILATSFKKIDPMPFTKYLDEGLNILERANEHDSDLYLAQIVRLQHLSQDMYLTESTTAPMQMYVKAFKVDLERLRLRSPCKDSNNIFLQLQYLTTEVLVWELSLNDLQDNKNKPLRTHLDDLFHLIEAIEALLEVFFSIPASEYLLLPFAVFGQFAHTFITLIKLASLEVDGWDIRDLSSKIDFGSVIDKAADNYEAATRSSPDGLRVNNEGFGKWAARTRWMKQVYEAKFVQEGDRPDDRQEGAKALMSRPGDYAIDSSTTTTTPAGMQQPTPPDDILSGDFFNYLDDNFWQSFAGDIDLGFPEMAMTG